MLVELDVVVVVWLVLVELEVLVVWLVLVEVDDDVVVEWLVLVELLVLVDVLLVELVDVEVDVVVVVPTSTAPTSQAGPEGRVRPRWSVAGHPGPVAVSISGLPA